MNARVALIFFIFISLINYPLLGQAVIDDIDSSSNNFTATAPDLSTESVEKISASGRVFILTNDSGSYGKGDFISIVLDNQLVSRHIVAKTEGGSGGIKTIKVYSQDLYKILRPGVQVQVIRGDDSYFNLQQKSASQDTGALIEDEENLFDETTLLEDDLELDEDSKRLIKTDNIISLFMAQVEAQGADGENGRESMISGAYSYQVQDNIWAEIGYGQTVLRDFPASSIDTTYTNLIAKLKYTVSAPFYSFIQPYIGYQVLNADSPGAGVQNDDGTLSQEDLDAELETIDALKQNRVVFGVTVLKRLVPGWFARLDLGTDSLNFGFSLEF